MRLTLEKKTICSCKKTPDSRLFCMTNAVLLPMIWPIGLIFRRRLTINYNFPVETTRTSHLVFGDFSAWNTLLKLYLLLLLQSGRRCLHQILLIEMCLDWFFNVVNYLPNQYDESRFLFNKLFAKVSEQMTTWQCFFSLIPQSRISTGLIIKTCQRKVWLKTKESNLEVLVAAGISSKVFHYFHHGCIPLGVYHFLRSAAFSLYFIVSHSTFDFGFESVLTYVE